MIQFPPDLVIDPAPPWADFREEAEAILREAEKLLGPGQSDRALVSIRADGSQVTEVDHDRLIVVHVQTFNVNDRPQARFQLSHEMVHVVSQIPDVPASTLEEGLATHFAKLYTYNKCHVVLNASDSYEQACADVLKLLSVCPNAILEIRKSQPVISLITASDITKVCKNCSTDIAEALTLPFY